MIVVTGATGHIGNVLVRELISQGKTVKALVLPGEDTTPLTDLNVEFATGDVRNLDSLEKTFQGAEMVYHLAGVISIIPGKKDILDEVNVKGTKNVIEACLRTGVRRLVYTSSIHAVREPPHGTIITEKQPFDSIHVLGEYAKSKAEATLEVIAAVKNGLDAVIVCPTGVIGPYDFRISEMGKLIKDFLQRKIQACVIGAYDFVDVRDVAHGMILAGEKGRAGESYILSGEQITIPDLFTMLEKNSGVKKPLLTVSSGMARLFGQIAAPFYAHTKKRPLFTTYSIDVLTSNSLVSSAKASRELGYQNRSIKESLIDTIIWFKEEAQKRCPKVNLKSSLTAI